MGRFNFLEFFRFFGGEVLLAIARATYMKTTSLIDLLATVLSEGPSLGDALIFSGEDRTNRCRDYNTWSLNENRRIVRSPEAKVPNHCCPEPGVKSTRVRSQAARRFVLHLTG